MDFALSPRAQDLVNRIRAFIKEHVDPLDAQHLKETVERHYGSDWRAWRVAPEVEALKKRAKAEKLWNLFLPDAEVGGGLSNVEYASLAEEMGKSFYASEIFNCNAPDTGNMEVLWNYGTPDKKQSRLRETLASVVSRD